MVEYTAAEAAGEGVDHAEKMATDRVFDKWTAHDDEFWFRDRSLAVAEQPAEGGRAPMSSSVVNFAAIIVGRCGAISSTPC